MSELLVGFDMPTDMAVFLAIDNGIVYAKTAQMKDWKRLDGVSVHHIPPHGRLIDADAMFKDICDSIDWMTAIGLAVDGQWLWDKLNDALENAPTIIEAEDGE